MRQISIRARTHKWKEGWVGQEDTVPDEIKEVMDAETFWTRVALLEDPEYEKRVVEQEFSVAIDKNGKKTKRLSSEYIYDDRKDIAVRKMWFYTKPLLVNSPYRVVVRYEEFEELNFGR